MHLLGHFSALNGLTTRYKPQVGEQHPQKHTIENINASFIGQGYRVRGQRSQYIWVFTSQSEAQWHFRPGTVVHAGQKKHWWGISSIDSPSILAWQQIKREGKTPDITDEVLPFRQEASFKRSQLLATPLVAWGNMMSGFRSKWTANHSTERRSGGFWLSQQQKKQRKKLSKVK